MVAACFGSRSHTSLEWPSLAAFSNMLLYNWQSNVGGLRSVNQEYPGQGLGTSVYVENIGAPLHGLLTLSSTVDPTRPSSVFEPFVLFVGAFSIVALVAVARRGTSLPMLIVLSALLFLPLVHDDFDPPLKSRYLMPLVPLIEVAIAVFLVRMVALRPVWLRIVAASIGLVAIAGSLGSLVQFESAMIADDCTNRPQRAFIAELERQSRPGEWILLDQGVLPSAERLG
jgi:hypothetical protein